jgi:hypothetical protein
MEELLEFMKSMQEELRTHGTKMENAEANRKADPEALIEMTAKLDKMEANWDIDREERKADLENLKVLMEEIMTTNQAKTDVKLKEPSQETERKKNIWNARRPRRRWVDNIRMDLRETGWDGMDWMDLAHDRDQWRALVNTVMNLRVP